MQRESHYTPNMSQHTSLTTNKYENIPVYSLLQRFLNFFIMTKNKGNEIIYIPNSLNDMKILMYTVASLIPFT
jgi:hypothetical protein